MNEKSIHMIALFVCLATVLGCGAAAVKPQAEFDTPGHHVASGDKFLKTDRLEAAAAEYQRALELNPEFAPAHVGSALVSARNKDFDHALQGVDKAASCAEGVGQQVLVHVGRMRIYIAGGSALEEDWLEEVEDNFEDAVDLDPRSAAAHFYMGYAYKSAYRFKEAETQLGMVIALQNGLVEEADREYALVQKITRAMPGTKMGKKIALLETIDRADVAALFIEELMIDTRFNRQVKPKDTRFQSPPEKTFVTGTYVKAPTMTDIDNHVLKADIEAIVAIGINGLQPFPDHTFRPDALVTRAEFAMILEDILIKINRDDKLATRFFGSQSPFPDVRNSVAYYNAVMVCVSSGLMSVTDPFTREFAPMRTISGADALLAIRVLKTEF
jgi:tetratricopeptide (TPR) repeat protein